MTDDESPDKYSRCRLNKEIVLPTTDIQMIHVGAESWDPLRGRIQRLSHHAGAHTV
ncbi:MAG: hypothetical protein J07HR59_01187 [Halorubrum sp. J07HR59]|nr:MAG: hypothetical protein J07HR59_01187 [Halorubrum sp. J07HR59]